MGISLCLFLNTNHKNCLKRCFAFIVFQLCLFSNQVNAQTSSTWFKTTDSTQCISFGDLDITGTALTVEALVYQTTVKGGADVVSKHRNPTDCNYLLRLGSSQLTTVKNGVTKFVTSNGCGSYSINTLYHLAMVYDGSYLYYYVNGQLESQVAQTDSMITNNYSGKVGNMAWVTVPTTSSIPQDITRAFTEQYIGYIDQVRIWNVARPADSLRKYMKVSLPNPTTQTGLKAYFHFNSLTNLQGNATYNGSLYAGKGPVNFGSIGNSFTVNATLPPDSCASFCSPGKVTGSMVWLKADAGVTGTTTVTGWNDQSGQYNNMTSSAAAAPSLQTPAINFNPAIQFDGTDDFMIKTSGILVNSTQTDLNVFAVVNTNKVTTNYLFEELTVNGGTAPLSINAKLPWSDGSVYYEAGDVANGKISTAWGGNTSDYFVWSLNSSTGSTTPSGFQKAIYRNGLNIATNSNVLAPTGNFNNFYLGSSSGGSANFFNGNIAEILLYNQAPTLAQQKRIESYFAIKYGIALDQTTLQNYVASDGTVVYPTATTNSTYKYNIAGIGRDDNSCLSQKQSYAQGNSDIITMGNTSIATTNQLNTNSFSSDKSFFVWGNDNGALAAYGVTDYDHSVLQGRMARVWKATETGTVGTLQILVNFANIKGVNNVIGANDLSNVRLLVNQNPVFATGTTYYSPSSYNNLTQTAYFNVDFTSITGYYFAIGTTNVSQTPLPIVLVNFDAKQVNGGVLVEWAVTSSHNSAYFIVERSQDGYNWQQIGKIPSKSDINYLEYSILDIKPLFGINYYKLVEVSTSGEKKNQSVVVVYVDISQKDQGILWDVFPNPSNGEFSIRLTNAEDSTAYGIALFDCLGKEVFSFKINNGEQSFVTSNISEGLYSLRLEKDKKYETKKLFLNRK